MKLATFLAAHAARRPDHVAVISGDRRMRFAELDESTTRAADALRRRGVGVGDRVAILLPNGIEFVQALLATIKAGAVAVPVNTRLSPEEMDYILDDCAPAAVFSGSDIHIGGLVGEGAVDLPEVPVDFSDCVISYTSGTTGKPKGAVLTQENYIVLNGYLNGLMWGLGPDDRQLITTPLAQRTGLARVMNMICHGCGLVIPVKFDAVQTASIIETEQVSFMGTVPTVARMLLPVIERDPSRFASLRTFVATGEAFPSALKERLHAVLPDLGIYSFYAMTEVGLVASMGPDEQFAYPASVGRVQPGVEACLKDDQFSDVQTGAVGELWVRTGEPGRFLSMRGYHNRPDDNARVIRNGWVATGDMGRFDDAGYLYLVDRKKDMIVSGGFNVYCKEVELVIAELPGVRDVAVTGVPDDVFGEAVAAFIELDTGVRLGADDIVKHCRQRIASYKKPRHVYFVDALPRSSAGKVLKRQLAAPVPRT
jgi:long-chain acyl-CoA synthetase